MAEHGALDAESHVRVVDGEYAQRAKRRFLAKVDTSDAHAGCWLWRGCVQDSKKRTRAPGAPDWRPRFWFRGKTCYAHIVAYMLWRGVIPVDRVVMHSCDNSLCVNPRHLTLGSQSENLRDCYARGRR